MLSARQGAAVAAQCLSIFIKKSRSCQKFLIRVARSRQATEARLSLQEAQTRWFGADAGAAELTALAQTQHLAQVVARAP
jgi:hypothetical protein